MYSANTRSFIRELRDKNILITLSGAELKIRTKSAGNISKDLLERIRERKQELIEYLKYYNLDLQDKEHAITIKREERPAHIPLSYSQERLWFIDQLEGSNHYHIPAVLRVHGRLDAVQLERAFRQVLFRHEVLRSVMLEIEGTAYQQVLSESGWSLNYRRIEEACQGSSYVAVQELLDRPFNLSSDYMLRAELQEYANEEQLLVVVLHHIAADGWSMPLLVQELVQLYKNIEGSLPELSVQYADYALWERRHLNGPLLEEGLAYWQSQLSGAGVLELPSDRARSASTGHAGSRCYTVLDGTLLSGLEQLSSQEGVTLYMTLLSAFKVLLYRYSGQTDISVGSPVANRSHHEIEKLIGFFVNTVVLRTELSGEESFHNLLNRVRQLTVDAYHYQHIPFEKVVVQQGLSADGIRNPLFQVMFVLQHESAQQQLVLSDDAVLSYEAVVSETSKFDLTLEVRVTDTGLKLGMEYNTGLFDAARIERMLCHYQELLKSIVADRNSSISSLGLLTSAEEQAILHGFNQIPFEYPRNTIVDLFSKQSQLQGEKTAVIFGDYELSYNMLDVRSSVVSRMLQDTGAGPGSVVPVCMERSPELVIALLGILKAGCAYVPIDPSYPSHRINHILEDTGAKMLISDEACYGIAASTGKPVLNISREDNSQLPQAITAASVSADSLAYIMYTSGSTGHPKGVMVTHANVVRLVRSPNYLSFNSEHILLATAAIAFDATIFEYWGILLNGGTLVFCNQHELLNTQLLGNAMRQYNVNLVWFTASWLHQLIDEDIAIFSQLKTLVAGGDKLSAVHIQRLLKHCPQLEVINGYGPTENTTFSLCHKVPADRIESIDDIPIGKPISNSTAYILHDGKTLCPVGVPGEICVGGAGVARGYLNHEALTAEKFIIDPFSGISGSRLYRTGDIGYWREDGTIMYVGRRDQQVKVRGYRIELGEIESVLQQYEGISQCAVLATGDDTGNHQLVAYVVATGTFDREGVQTWLRSHLPAYMVPGIFIPLDRLPLTTNGKLDRRALPPVSGLITSTREYVAAGNDTEHAIATIWQELLGIESVSINDNFFELGGHSLLAARVMSRLRSVLDIAVSIRDIFSYPVLAELSAYIIKSGAGVQLPAIVREERPAHIPLSYSQERLWFIDQLEGSIHYHIPAVLRVHGRLDAVRLERAFRQVLSRHEVLRSVMLEVEGTAYQQVLSDSGWSLGYRRIEGACQGSNHVAVQELLNRPFNLSSDYMLRAELQEYENEEQLLVVVLHHIAADGWSMPLLVQELVQLYKNIEDSLPGLRVQYADYALWERRHLNGPLLDEGLAYWQSQLSGAGLLELPSDRTRSASTGHAGSRCYSVLDGALLSGLEQLSSQEGVTLYMTLLSAFKVLLYRYSGQTDISVGSPVANRSHHEIEKLIGFFVNTVVLRTELSGAESFLNLLGRVRQLTVDAYHYQHIPFEKVVGKQGLPADRSRHPLFQVMFAMQQEVVSAVELGDVTLEEERVDQVSSKFDLSMELRPLGTGPGYQIALTYNSGLYSDWRMQGLLMHYEQLLRSILSSPGMAISSLELLSAEEMKRLKGYNGDSVPYPVSETLVSLFKQQAILQGELPALLYGDRQLSYRELDHASTQLAHYLRKRGVVRGSLVGLCLERSQEMVIGILGIQKAGGAYVPIDPSYPPDRINYIISDTRCQLIVSDGSLSATAGDYEVIDLLNLRSEISKEPVTDLTEGPQPSDLAYVIYTSGSTGRPKGVLVEHQQVLNRLCWAQRHLGLNEQDIQLHKTTFCFDVSVGELFSPLLAGAQMVIAGPEDHKDPEKIRALIETHQVTCVHFVPSMLDTFLLSIPKGACSSLKHVVCSGEALKVGHLAKYREKLGHAALYNLYGPTEAAIDVTCWDGNTPDLPANVPIGKPIDNTPIYIVDSEYRLVPVGIIGQLCIGGIQVARGYLNRPELTEEKFRWITIDGQSPVRVYCTGDLASWLPDGNIAYLGRRDDQVKIRGYRIELEEIENAVRSLPGVKQSAVVVKKDQQDNSMLIGYVVMEGGLQAQWLSAELKKRLPDYMLPAAWIELDAIPVTANGKLDKKALPEVQLGNADRYEAAGDITEHQLLKTWQELLLPARIGIRDSFFELGGNSLNLAILKNRIRQSHGVDISLKTLFSLTDIASQASYIRNAKLSGGYQDIPLAPIAENYPLSSAQQRIWVLCQTSPEITTAYNMHAFYQISGIPDLDLLEKAFSLLITRHEILRTNFVETPAGVRQVIRDTEAADFRLEYEDMHTVMDWQELHRQVTARITRPMDLENEGLVKAAIWRTGEQEYFFVFQTHHIISDGWSLKVMVRELFQYYQRLASGTTPVPASLPLQYKDYACWQISRVGHDHLKDAEAYWRSLFADEIPVLQLQGTFARPSKNSFKGKVCRKELKKEVARKLQVLCKEEEVTLFMLMLAALKTVLYKYTGQEDIIVGTPVAGRIHPALEGQLGFYANTLPLRTAFNGGEDFHTLLQSIKTNALQAFEYQEYPFNELVNNLLNAPGSSRASLFDVMLVYGDDPHVQEQLQLNGLSVSPYRSDLDNGTSKFDLSMIVQTRQEEIALALEYNTGLFDEAFASRMLTHVVHILEQVSACTTAPLSQLACCTPEEVAWLALQNDTAGDYDPFSGTVMHLFHAQALRSPTDIALADEKDVYTYQQLNEVVNAYSRYLSQEYGVGQGTVVAVMLPRSCWSAITVLSIMNLGAVYVPLDASLPAARLEYMLSDSHADVLITTEELLPATATVPISLVSDFDKSKWTGESLPDRIDNSGASYIIYTSGTTGVPKGVKQTYLTLYNLIRWDLTYGSKTGYARHLQYASMGFDMALHDLFATLCSGGALYILAEERRREIPSLVNYILRHGITSISMTYSALQTFFTDYSQSYFNGHQLRQVIAAGEQLYVTGGLRSFLQDNEDVILYNYYGPTETHVITATKYSFSTGEVPVKASIGRPVWNSSVYILNKDGQLSPPGIEGEIYLGGWNLAIGYQGNQMLTEQKFVPDIFSPGNRLYKTGDRGRWLPDGNIEYLGRTDDQVKIRGYRVEPDEITQVLCGYEGVSEAIAVVHIAEEAMIIAYVVAEDSASLTADKMAAFAAIRLPHYMQPSAYVFLEHFPLNANGKINKSLLPLPDLKHVLLNTAYTAPASGIEEQLITLWQEVLGKEGIGTAHNFFESGGQSLKAALLSVKINKAFNCFIKVSDIYRHPTISEQATVISQTKEIRMPQITPLKEGGRYQVSASQEMILTFNEFNPAATAVYNIPLSCTVNTAIDVDRLHQALQYIVERHESLRTYFGRENGKYFQAVEVSPQVDLPLEDIAILPIAGQQQYIVAAQDQERYQPFDIGKYPLYRFRLIRTATEQFVLMTTFHHIIFDAWSAQVLLKELAEIYTAFSEKRLPLLPALNIQYKDYAHWHGKMLDEGRFASNASYWMSKLRDASFPMKLPVDFNHDTDYTGAIMKMVVPAAQLSAMDTYCREERISSFVYLLSCISLALSNWADTDQIMIGLPVAGRFHEELSNQIGFYVNMLPLYLDINDVQDFKTLSGKVENGLLAAIDNQMVPFTHIMQQFLTETGNVDHIFNVVVNMGNIDVRTSGLADEQEIRQLFRISRANDDTRIFYTKNQLTITLYVIDGDLHIYFSYLSKLFKEETIQILHHRFRSIWEKLVPGRTMLLEELKTDPVVAREDYGDWVFDFDNY